MSGPDGRMSGEPDVRAVGPDVRGLDPADELMNSQKIVDIGTKFVRICQGKRRKRVGNARATRNQANPWIKFNKISSNSQITKKFGMAIFVGIFEIGTKQSKIRLENYGGGSKIMINVAHDTKMM
jgi:hypothetical protein